MKIIVHVTREIYRKSQYCGLKGHGENVRQNCAIALAVKTIAPQAEVSCEYIHWLGENRLIRELPDDAKALVTEFDRLGDNGFYSFRLELPEFSFEVDFPDELVEKIGINEVKAILEKSKTLELA